MKYETLVKRYQILGYEPKEKELKSDILYETYSGLSFFQIWKKCNNWKKVITYSIIGCVAIVLLCSSNILPLIFFPPFLFLLSSVSNTLEVKIGISHIKNKRTN